MNGKHCPNCNRDIGVWAIIKIGWPTLLKCPHCKSKLSYEPIGIGMLLLSFFAYLFLLILSTIIVLLYLPLTLLAKIFIFIIMAAVFWQPFEFFMVKRLRSRHNLIIRK